MLCFCSIIQSGGLSFKENRTECSGVRMDVSLITGRVRQIGVESDEIESSEVQGQMVKRNHMTVANTSGSFLASQTLNKVLD